MKSYLLKISSPEGDLFSGEVIAFCVRGVEGDVAIMAGHVPFITAVKPCTVKIVLEDGEERLAKTEGGMLSVFKDKTVFLTGNLQFTDSKE